MIVKCRFFIAALLLAVLLVGCSQAAAPAPETVPTTAPTTQPTETEPEETLSLREQTPDWGRYREKKLNYETEKWAGPDETWEKGRYTDPSAINADIYFHGFREIYMENALIEANTGVSAFTDVEYYFKEDRVHMVFTYTTFIGTPEEQSVKWEFHGERTDERLDISGVGNPDPWASTIYNIQGDGMIFNSYTSMDGTRISLYYSPDTGYMYSLHRGPEVEYAWTPEMICNYPGQLPQAFRVPPSEPVQCEFSLYMAGADTKTYQFDIGMTCREWVNSEYNIDGWYRDGEFIVSADEVYALWCDDMIYPKMTASIYSQMHHH